jgi:hypothetical protein
MKSPMVQNLGLSRTKPADLDDPKAVRGGYSDLQVLESAAGFYIGTLYEEFDASGECLVVEPGSRDSGYFATQELASSNLTKLLDGGPVTLRDTP